MDLKKSVLALLALGLSGVASAGGFMPAPACSNHPVLIPCERTAWDLGYTLYWVRPSSNFVAATVPEFTTPLDFEELLDYKNDIGHRYGFGLEASYHWSTGNDLNLNWTRFHRANGFRYVGEGQNSVTVSDVRTDIKFDELNLEFGQMLNVGPNWDWRAHMGGTFTRIDIDSIAHSATGTSEGDAIADLIAGSFTSFGIHSEVKGVGPRVGFDMTYHLNDQFSVVGHTALSLIFGDRTAEIMHGNAVTPGLMGALGNTYFATHDRHGVMLGAGGKFGFAYNTNFHDMNLLFEGGYTVMTYHDGIDVLGVFTSPFNLDGVYLKAKVVS